MHSELSSDIDSNGYVYVAYGGRNAAYSAEDNDMVFMKSYLPIDQMTAMCFVDFTGSTSINSTHGYKKPLLGPNDEFYINYPTPTGIYYAQYVDYTWTSTFNIVFPLGIVPRNVLPSRITRMLCWPPYA